MVLPTMTLEEIRKEIDKEYPILNRKMNYVMVDLQKKLGKAVKKQDYTLFFDYVSKFKNNWIYKIYISRKKSNYVPMLLYHNGKGHAGIGVTFEKKIIYHTGHFFERYNERGKLGLNSLNDIIKAYMAENTFIQFQELEEIGPGIFTIFGNIPSGIVLGMFNKPLQLVKANTFLTNEMLTPNQQEQKEQLKASLEKYKNTSDILN